jgi:hypothetical protein
VIARLTSLRAEVGSEQWAVGRTADMKGLLTADCRLPTIDTIVDDIVRELDAARARAKGLRGDARTALLERLRALDAQLIDAARQRCDAGTLQALGTDADTELAPFRTRMPQEAYERTREACVDRLLRERAKLPVIAYE